MKLPALPFELSPWTWGIVGAIAGLPWILAYFYHVLSLTRVMGCIAPISGISP